MYIYLSRVVDLLRYLWMNAQLFTRANDADLEANIYNQSLRDQLHQDIYAIS